jgi:Phage shock protein A (IM30), suppresses sigma54-dependent transcription
MGIFKRISDIVSSNVNSALDKLEDPEKMIDLSITELEEAITEMNSTLAERKVALDSLKKLIASEKDSVARWTDRAVLAARKGDDDMAREAITEKQRLSQKLASDEDSAREIESILATLADTKAEASAKLQEMKAKSLELKTRAKVAKERMKTNEKLHESSDASYVRRMEEMKAKIEKWEAMADITKPVETPSKPSFEEMEKNEAVEKELEEIKAAQKSKKEGK